MDGVASARASSFSDYARSRIAQTDAHQTAQRDRQGLPHEATDYDDDDDDDDADADADGIDDDEGFYG
jgi:hypothetical protein